MTPTEAHPVDEKYMRGFNDGFREARRSAPPANFGYALREARTAARISLREAAELLGTTVVRLGEVERGVREPPMSTTPRGETDARASTGEG